MLGSVSHLEGGCSEAKVLEDLRREVGGSRGTMVSGRTYLQAHWLSRLHIGTAGRQTAGDGRDRTTGGARTVPTLIAATRGDRAPRWIDPRGKGRPLGIRTAHLDCQCPRPHRHDRGDAQMEWASGSRGALELPHSPPSDLWYIIDHALLMSAALSGQREV